MLGFLRSLALPALFLVASHPALADEEAPRINSRLAEVSAPAAPVVEQDYEPDPAMWRLADEDTTLYFFGTYHALPEGFRWRTPLLEEVIGKSDEIVFESRNQDEEDIDFEAIFGGSPLTMLAREPVSTRLAKENRQKWVKLSKQMELPFFIFDRLPPTLALLFAGVAASEMAGSQGELGVETALENDFRAAKKPISAIEDPNAVMRNVLAIDEKLAIAELDQTLSEWDGESLVAIEDGEVVADWSSEHSWARGRLGEEDFFDDWDDSPFSQALYQVLLVDRNKAWADWVAERMEKPGTVLIAVGAGHFEGPDSVQAMLAKKGLTVERLNPPAPAEETEAAE